MLDNARGPKVDAVENLYRAITCPEWWKPEREGPSSAAFNWPKFSADIASLCTPNATLSRLKKRGCGLVQFNCGEARKLEFDARDELDQEYPDNHAHAHVYCNSNPNQRKRQARKLSELCVTIRPPSF